MVQKRPNQRNEGQNGDGDLAQSVRAPDCLAADAGSIPGAARDFLPRLNLQCRLSFDVRTPPSAIAFIYICAHVRDAVVHVRVGWILATQTYPARTISDKTNQLDDCGR